MSLLSTFIWKLVTEFKSRLTRARAIFFLGFGLSGFGVWASQWVNEGEYILPYWWSRRLSIWVGQDCCRWKGVGCSNTTGHIVKLDLRNPFPYNDDRYDAGYDRTFEKASLKLAEVNPSLLELRHLMHLDSSWNNFSGMQIISQSSLDHSKN
ncbi:hypothetical protein IFM89_038997 [Coptis chinensis]|uniref:Leucine-rich repeat-containing N-terminal plant-type domain-containing protein n=1 Tax=Coptis chinensis TaxID=261450 RepID=A0A835M3J7_9MAGN|nr:hypothetical protein IFM89_038997 [Coptis chinensis]